MPPKEKTWHPVHYWMRTCAAAGAGLVERDSGAGASPVESRGCLPREKGDGSGRRRGGAGARLHARHIQCVPSGRRHQLKAAAPSARWRPVPPLPGLVVPRLGCCCSFHLGGGANERKAGRGDGTSGVRVGHDAVSAAEPTLPPTALWSQPGFVFPTDPAWQGGRLTAPHLNLLRRLWGSIAPAAMLGRQRRAAQCPRSDLGFSAPALVPQPGVFYLGVCLW
jgi:hypothetical protein